MQNEQIRVLDESQVQSFDTEYVDTKMWSVIESILSERAAVVGTKFSFLDIGGGNGKFSDRVLNRFIECRGHLLDNSPYLLSLNTASLRKTVLEVDVDHVNRALGDQKFDIIFMNWVLHHFVKGGYRETLQTQVDVLNKTKSLLSENGRIIVIENLPTGIFGEALCSFTINRVTSSKIIAPFVKKMGGNTAGVGICFLGELLWKKQFDLAGLEVEQLVKFEKWDLNPLKKVLLTIDNIRVGIFVLSKASY